MKTAKRDLDEKARKKYKLDEYESYKESEEYMNERIRPFKPITYHADRYDRQVEKAESYVNKHMMEQFGESSYKTWKKNETTKEAIALGSALIGSLGLMAVTTRM